MPATSSHPRRPKATPPRPMNSFFQYRADKLPALKAATHGKQEPMKELLKIIGEMWSNEPAHVRAHYEGLARAAHLQHQKDYPGYKFSPSPRREKTSQKSRSSKVKSPGSLDGHASLTPQNFPTTEHPGASDRGLDALSQEMQDYFAMNISGQPSDFDQLFFEPTASPGTMASLSLMGYRDEAFNPPTLHLPNTPQSEQAFDITTAYQGSGGPPFFNEPPPFQPVGLDAFYGDIGRAPPPIFGLAPPFDTMSPRPPSRGFSPAASSPRVPSSHSSRTTSSRSSPAPSSNALHGRGHRVTVASYVSTGVQTPLYTDSAAQTSPYIGSARRI